MLVGLRFGATLAVLAAESDDRVAGVVLWDPVVNGRRYVRALQLLGNAADPSDADGGVSVAGVPFTQATLDDIAAIRISADRMKPVALILADDAAGEVASLVNQAQPDVEVLVVSGTRALLDTDAEISVIPRNILKEIERWIVAQSPGGAKVMPQPVLETEAREHSGPITIVHRARRIGTAQIFAIDSTPTGAAPSHVAVTLNNGVAASIGPGGAWLELAHRLNQAGWRVLRIDLSGLGDTPTRPGRIENDNYPASAVADVDDLLGGLDLDEISAIATIGLCSGALLGFDIALAHEAVGTVVAINGRFDKPFTDRRHHRGKRASGQTQRLIAIPLSKTPLLGRLERMPEFLWRALDRLHLVASPSVAIERVVEANKRVLMVFGDDEWGLGALQTRSGRRFGALLQHGAVTQTLIAGLDHSMFAASARSHALDVVVAYLRGYSPEPRSVAAVRPQVQL